MRQPSHSLPKKHRAAALLIVLASLVFLAALALAFLASIGTELKSSKQYADGVSATLLSQSAFNLATDQIVAATKGYSGNDPDNPGQLLAWASQPGMIRTYDANGNKAGYFKLYSWDVMQGRGDFDPSASTETISSSWFNDPAIYTDLNKPVTVNQTLQYPIVDGNNLKTAVKDSAGILAIPGKTYDSDNDNKWDIEGFHVATSAPVETGSTANPVPMPVKWLYVLQDGKIVAPNGGSGNTASFSGSSAPTTANPIVGRVAFWTDDETCKININTASEGVYWDTPRVKSRTDDILKIDQPVNGEYQRYPGHPAMTSLSTVFRRPSTWTPGGAVPTFSGGGSPGAVSFTLTTPALWNDFQWAQKLYGLTPRIGTGGSFAGSVQTAMLGTNAIPPVVLDSNRLYASTDELQFRPDRTSNNLELADQPVLNKQTLERAKFFLTASSRAPDVNLFNKPRVSIWPVHSSTSPDYRTPFDRLIAFCGTFGSGTNSYYFVREDPSSPTADLTKGRNSLLLSYVRNMAEQNIPGFGGNFAAKYPQDKDQIVTEIFDYIRSTNLRDGRLVGAPESASKTYTRGITGSPWGGTIGIGQVVPIQDGTTNTRGFGRFPTLQGVSVVFIGQVDGDGPLAVSGTAPGPADIRTQVDPFSGLPLPYTSGTTTIPSVPTGHMRVQAMFIPQFFCPSVGSVWMRPNFQWSADLTNLRISGTGLEFPNNLNGDGTPKQYNQNVHPFDETGFGDQLGLAQVVKASGENVVSKHFVLPKGSFSLKGTVTVKIWAADPVASPNPSTTELQTFTLDFESSPACATPDLAFNHVANKIDNGNFEWGTTTYYLNYRTFGNSVGIYNQASPGSPTPVQGGRIKGAIATTNAGGFFMDGDAVRSIRIAGGDPRIVAGRRDPSSLFEPNPTTDRLFGAHNFFTGYGHAYYGAGMGKLVKDLAYSGTSYFTGNRQNTNDGPQIVFFSQGYSSATDAPLNGVEVGSNSSISGGIPGDWDNTVMANRDGPYINKPDEGDQGTSTYEPYFWKLKAQSPGSLSASLFSPNRQVPSAVNFGSLPTGVKSNRPWQTLLFRPQPGHPGSKGFKGDGTADSSMPADHLLLDLFHMPVVEPYAISEPLSTAGRINMNYQMVPFTYINRDTGIRALLKAEKVIAIQDTQVGVYKQYKYTSSPNPTQASIRLDVNPEETLKGFTQRFEVTKDIFRSASEICELPIVPVDAASTDDTYNNMTSYWNTRRLTGDNSKERIYATLYPRLTTKSNTFTIHAKVQTLKKLPGTPANVWTEGKDQVTGEYRGSQTIERYADPNNVSIPDYADAAVNKPISSFYKTRVISSKQFAP